MLNTIDDPTTGNLGDLYDAGDIRLTDHAAEQQLVGFLLNKPAALTETIEIIAPSDLHDPLHRCIYDLLVKAYHTDTPITMELLKAGLGDSIAPTIARLISAADPKIDVSDLADHLSTIAERRAVGTVDDDYLMGEHFTSKFGAQRWEEIGTGAKTDLYPWLVEDIIPLNDISMAFGHTGTGKSFNIFDLSMCVARGIPFNGRNVEPGLVIYVAAEAGKGFAKRKIAYAIQNKLEPSDPLPFVLLTKRPNFYQDDADAVALIEEIKAIKRTYKATLRLIVIDTVSAATQGMDEISGKDQSVVRKRFMMLQQEFNAAIIVVHHKPKDGSGPRGHGSQSADIETTIEFETRSDYHCATLKKQREGKAGVMWEFTLSVVEVGKNKWGNPETSCVVLPRAAPGVAAAAKTGFHATSTEMLLLRALYDALIDHPSPPPAGLPPSISKVVEQRHVRVLMRERFIAPDEDSSAADGRFRTAFSRAAAKLRDGAVIGVQGNLLWPTGKPVHGFSG